VIPYDDRFAPPAPALTIGLSSVHALDRVVPLMALLDTAADICALPDRLIEELELPPVEETVVVGFAEQPIPALVYLLAIHVAGVRLYPARAVAHRADYALLGRNVLNSLHVRLDGPALQFELDARPARRP
jgi:predicted aspartyl protease